MIFFFCPKIPSRTPHHIKLSCLLGLLLAVLLSLTLLVSDALASFEELVLCRMSLTWDLPDIVLTIRLGLWVWGRKTTEIIRLYQGRAYTINMTFPCWCCPWPPGWGYIWLLHCKINSFSIRTFPYCTLWKEVYGRKISTHLGFVGWGLAN